MDGETCRRKRFSLKRPGREMEEDNSWVEELHSEGFVSELFSSPLFSILNPNIKPTPYNPYYIFPIWGYVYNSIIIQMFPYMGTYPLAPSTSHGQWKKVSRKWACHKSGNSVVNWGRGLYEGEYLVGYYWWCGLSGIQ